VTEPQQALYARASARMAAGDPAAALHELGAIAPDTESIDSLYLRAAAATQVGDLAQAKAAVHACLEHAPEHPGAQFQAGAIALAEGDRAGALAHFAQAAALAPGFAAAHYNLAVLQAESGEREAAEASYQAALRADPGLMQAANNLASLLLDRQAVSEALVLLQRTLKRSPGFAIGWCTLGRALLRAARVDEAEAALRRSVELDSRGSAAWENLGDALSQLGRTEDADAAFEHATRASDPSSRLLFKRAALRGETPPAPPEDFVRELFDQMAGEFDTRLVDGLGYRLPTQLDAYLPAGEGLDILDLGCGTGLSAPLLRPRARRLEGVDLSPQMIERARQRGLYDALHVDSLQAFLEAGPESAWDLMLAADVVIYVGALGALFAAVRRGLRPGGHLLLSVEMSPEADYLLQPSGRYAHGFGYLQRLGREHELGIDLCEPIELRRERGTMLQGAVLRLQRPA